MSKENVIKFMEDVSKDSKLMDQLKKRVENLKDSKDEDAKAKETCRFAKEKGYDFSLEELKYVVAKKPNSGEVSDEALENVAGGAITYTWDGNQGSLGINGNNPYTLKDKDAFLEVYNEMFGKASDTKIIDVLYEKGIIE